MWNCRHAYFPQNLKYQNLRFKITFHTCHFNSILSVNKKHYKIVWNYYFLSDFSDTKIFKRNIQEQSDWWIKYITRILYE